MFDNAQRTTGSLKDPLPCPIFSRRKSQQRLLLCVLTLVRDSS